jgi:hypothetical protein
MREKFSKLKGDKKKLLENAEIETLKNVTNEKSYSCANILVQRCILPIGDVA